MIDFLEECNISRDTINEINAINYPANIYNFSCHKKEVIDIINYFNSIGLTCIDELLLYKLNIFLLTKEEIANKLNRYLLEEIVKLLNSNYEMIDTILYNK